MRSLIVPWFRISWRQTPAVSILSATKSIDIRSKRYIKNYDKRIKLLPEDVQYRYDDERFFTGPSWCDEPYIKPTDDEMVALTNLKLEKDIQVHIEVDPHQEPFNEVWQDQPDREGRFTGCEPVPDADGAVWRCVERLMPRQTVGELRPGSRLLPPPIGTVASGTELPYHVQRTRTRLYPIYRDYVVVDRDGETYWKNRWDHMFNKYHCNFLDNLDEIKWENNEKTIVVTKVLKIVGDIWKFEEDCRNYLQQRYNRSEPILTAVSETIGSVEFKGDFLDGLQDFFRHKGF